MKAIPFALALLPLTVLSLSACDSGSASDPVASPAAPVVLPIDLPAQSGHDAPFLDSTSHAKYYGQYVPLNGRDTAWMRFPVQKDSSYILGFDRYYANSKTDLAVAVFEGNRTVPSASAQSESGSLSSLTLEARASADGWMRIGFLSLLSSSDKEKIGITLNQGDRYDGPDGTRAGATLLPADSTAQTHRIFEDTDWVRIPTVPGKAYVVKVTTKSYSVKQLLAASETGAITEVPMLDNAAAFVASGAQEWFGALYRNSWGGADTVNRYDLRAWMLPDDADGLANTKTAARSLKFGDTARGIVNLAAPDWHKVSLEPGVSYTASISRGSNVPVGGYVMLTVFGSDSVALTSNTMGVGNITSSAPSTFEAPADGTVYLRAALNGGEWADYRLYLVKK